MKKIVYLLSALMLAFTACDPMEDVYDELDKIAADKADETDVVTTLTAAEYKLLKNVPDYITKKNYFATEDEAIQHIPAILASKYAHLGNGADAFVTYNQQIFPGAYSSTVAKVETYTAQPEDYDVTGDGKYDNFNSAGDLEKFLDYKYPDAVENQLVVFTFNYYLNGATVTLTDSFYRINGAWVDIYHVTAADYASVGKNADFSSSDDAVLKEYFNKFLKNRYYGSKEGDVQYVSYAYYKSGSATQKVMVMGFDGANWNPVTSDAVKAVTLKFNKKANEWNVDFTIDYTLVNADYDWIGKNNPTPDYGTTDNRANLAQYRSFYVEKQDNRFWSQEDIDKAIIAFAKHQFPNPKKGVKYKISYKIYNASTITVYSLLEQDGNGGFNIIDRSN